MILLLSNQMSLKEVFIYDMIFTIMMFLITEKDTSKRLPGTHGNYSSSHGIPQYGKKFSWGVEGSG